jgi:hypothetical protein
MVKTVLSSAWPATSLMDIPTLMGGGGTGAASKGVRLKWKRLWETQVLCCAWGCRSQG